MLDDPPIHEAADIIHNPSGKRHGRQPGNQATNIKDNKEMVRKAAFRKPPKDLVGSSP